jgi:menaquinone-9 beta-reductase
MQNGSQAFDVVIVGGGPAGATAGMILAKSRLSVLILDKARFPRDKPCAGLLSGRAAATLVKLYEADAIAGLTRTVNTGCRMFNRFQLLSEAAGGDATYAITRRELDALLLETAKQCGCHVREESRAVAVEGTVPIFGQRPGTVAKRSAAARKWDCPPPRPAVVLASGERVRASIIIGADGARSVVAKCIRHAPRDDGHHAERDEYIEPAHHATRDEYIEHKRMAMGLVAEVPLATVKTEFREDCGRALHLFLGIVPWGYGWIFPKGEHVSVGVGGLPRKAAELGGSFRELVNEYFEPGTWPSLRISGHPVPMGRFSPRLGGGSVLLAGDAARLVEPITGEGIAFALESGELAAEAAAEALARGNPELAGAIYAARMRRSIVLHLRQAALAGWLFFPPPCYRLAMRVLGGRPRVLEHYLQILSGKLSYPAFFRRVAYEIFLGKRSG